MGVRGYGAAFWSPGSDHACPTRPLTWERLPGSGVPPLPPQARLMWVLDLPPSESPAVRRDALPSFSAPAEYCRKCSKNLTACTTPGRQWPWASGKIPAESRCSQPTSPGCTEQVRNGEGESSGRSTGSRNLSEEKSLSSEVSAKLLGWSWRGNWFRISWGTLIIFDPFTCRKEGLGQITTLRVWGKRSHGEFDPGGRQPRIWSGQQSVQCGSERRRRHDVRAWSGEEGPKVPFVPQQGPELRI